MQPEVSIVVPDWSAHRCLPKFMRSLATKMNEPAAPRKPVVSYPNDALVAIHDASPHLGAGICKNARVIGSACAQQQISTSGTCAPRAKCGPSNCRRHREPEDRPKTCPFRDDPTTHSNDVLQQPHQPLDLMALKKATAMK